MVYYSLLGYTVFYMRKVCPRAMNILYISSEIPNVNMAVHIDERILIKIYIIGRNYKITKTTMNTMYITIYFCSNAIMQAIVQIQRHLRTLRVVIIT